MTRFRKGTIKRGVDWESIKREREVSPAINELIESGICKRCRCKVQRKTEVLPLTPQRNPNPSPPPEPLPLTPQENPSPEPDAIFKDEIFTDIPDYWTLSG
jgi:hypothetical protein